MPVCTFGCACECVWVRVSARACVRVIVCERDDRRDDKKVRTRWEPRPVPRRPQLRKPTSLTRPRLRPRNRPTPACYGFLKPRPGHRLPRDRHRPRGGQARILPDLVAAPTSRRSGSQTEAAGGS